MHHTDKMFDDMISDIRYIKLATVIKSLDNTRS